jgi:hypothetical protein
MTGRAVACLAEAAQISRVAVASFLALPDRDERLPERGRAAAQTRAAPRLRAEQRSSARRRTPRRAAWVEPYPGEVLSLEDGFASPEARLERLESVELAFVAAPQVLPARQRAGTTAVFGLVACAGSGQLSPECLFGCTVRRAGRAKITASPARTNASISSGA